MGTTSATEHSQPFLKEWSKINYYDENGRSEILNSDFFLSSTGQNNPTYELETFTKLLKAYQQDGLNVESICKHPARIHLFKQHASWFTKPIHCKKYEDAVNPKNVKSVSLIYASGYLSNPASYYGHAMLRMNYKDKSQQKVISGGAMNYGAMNISDNPLIYIVQGIFGGYKGRYTENDNFINTHNYTNRELRDVWEYELNFNEQETQYLLAQLWELKSAVFRYYFFNNNCAHRIGKPIENIIGEDITSSHSFWLMPIQLVQNLNNVKNGLAIKDEKREPSAKSILNEKLIHTSSEEKSNITKLLRTDGETQKQIAQTLSTNELVLSLEQLDVLIAQLKNEKKNTKKRERYEAQRNTILRALFTRNNKNQIIQTYKPSKQISPSNTNGVSKLSLAYEHTQGNNKAIINYSPALSDFTDKPMSGQQVSRFKMGETELVLNGKNDIDIRKLRVLDIRSLASSNLPADISGDKSWGVSIEYSAQNKACEKCSTAKVKGLKGITKNLKNQTTLYGLIGGEVEHKRYSDYQYISAISEIGFIKYFKNDHSVNVELSTKSNHKLEKHDSKLNATYAHKLNKQYELNLYSELTDNEGTTAGIKAVWKFN